MSIKVLATTITDHEPFHTSSEVEMEAFTEDEAYRVTFTDDVDIEASISLEVFDHYSVIIINVDEDVTILTYHHG